MTRRFQRGEPSFYLDAAAALGMPIRFVIDTHIELAGAGDCGTLACVSLKSFLPFVIRPFEPRDRAALLSCITELQDVERALDQRLRPGKDIAQAYCDQLQHRCAEQCGTILVAESEGQVAGFAAVQARVPYEGLDDPPGHFALVSDLLVLAPYRRRGIGHALLVAAEAYARTQGAGELQIGVLAANGPARQLYRALGFTAHFETRRKPLRGDNVPR